MTILQENPLRVGLRQERVPQPQILVIFGATGDLTQRKLIPALYDMYRDRRLPPEFTVVGVARREWDTDFFRQHLRKGVEDFGGGIGPEEVWASFEQGLFYQPSNIDVPEDYLALKDFLADLDEKRGTRQQRTFYLAVSPNLYPEAIQQLGKADMLDDPQRTRMVIEKPFGHDLSTAQALNRTVLEVCRENQVFRIDHYLGKETVQNLLVFRFANTIFEPLWNRQYIDNIQVTVAETVGVEGRAGYYESAGALRDMIQNHITQILCLTAMEPPAGLEAESIRNEKVKVLQSTRLADLGNLDACAIRGQYKNGWMGGKSAPGYRTEPGVKPESTTETYVALKLLIDNWRWTGVPFYIRTGKRMPRKVSEVAIQFKDVPLSMFESASRFVAPNLLILRIQPDEGISLRFEAKAPGSSLRTRSVEMEFSYEQSFGEPTVDAYSRLLIDAMLGDQTLFTRADEVEAAWAVYTPALESWESPNSVSPLCFYDAGSWGPFEAEDMLEKGRHKWRRP